MRRRFSEIGQDWKLPTDNTFNFKCDLDEDKFSPDKSRRQMFKLIINSFYGRFGMSNATKNKTLNFEKSYEGAKRFKACFDNPRMEVKDFSLDISNNYQLTYRDIDDIGSAKNTNLPTAIFTTAYSRVMLHRIMEKVGYENVLMTDTDSCIFKYKTTDKKLGKENALSC